MAATERANDAVVGLKLALGGWLLEYGLGHLVAGLPIQPREALPPPALEPGNRDGIERLAKERETLQRRLLAIDEARKAICQLRFRDDVCPAVVTQLQHNTAIIDKAVRQAREQLAAVHK